MLRMEAKSGVGRPLGAHVEMGEVRRSPVDSTAGVIHDLGNLIQIASSALNIASRSPQVQGDLEPVLAGAKVSLQQAGVLVRQTISRARQSADVVEDVNLAVCLAEIAALIQIAWKDEVRLDIQVEPGIPIVKCDRLGLQNAILNLLFNAHDAMPDGGVVSMRADEVSLEPGEPAIALRVVDSGIGMTPDTIARALEPFFTTKPGGLGGVGLPMVERFARESGGRVLVESEYGVGTTVTLQLPAYPSEQMFPSTPQE